MFSIKTVTKFTTAPPNTMSLIDKYPVEKTMALGGVPTGSKNANDALRVIGIMKYSGCTCMEG